MQRNRIVIITCGIMLGLIGAWSIRTVQAEKPPVGTVRIGVVPSLFRDSNGAAAIAQAQPLGDVIASTTGIRIEFVYTESSEDLAKRLNQGELQLGVMHGIEYAWIRNQNPELEPLVLAMNQSTRLKGVILVRDDDKAQKVGELHNQTLALPRKTMNHCYHFLHKKIAEAGQDPKCFFSAVKTPTNVDAAIDEVVDGKATTIVVDAAAWDVYRQRKPGRAAKLRVLLESGIFPTAAILHKPGAMSDDLTKRVRDGLVTAHEKPIGKQILLFWRLTRFVHVPADYNDLLRDIVKEYPEPVGAITFTTEAK